MSDGRSGGGSFLVGWEGSSFVVLPVDGATSLVDVLSGPPGRGIRADMFAEVLLQARQRREPKNRCHPGVHRCDLIFRCRRVT